MSGIGSVGGPKPSLFSQIKEIFTGKSKEAEVTKPDKTVQKGAGSKPEGKTEAVNIGKLQSAVKADAGATFAKLQQQIMSAGKLDEFRTFVKDDPRCGNIMHTMDRAIEIAELFIKERINPNT